MGMTTNIIIFSFVLSFVIYMGTPTHSSSLFFSIVTGHTEQLYSRIVPQLSLIFVLSGAAAVAVVLLGQGVSYALFAGIATFLLSFLTLPADVLMETEIPIEIKTLIIGVFGIMYVMAMLSWFKGDVEA